MNEALFRRIVALYRQRDGTGPRRRTGAGARPLSHAFRRAGALLERSAKVRLAEINERLATIGTAFSQNVLADEQAYTLVLETEEDLAGLPNSLRAAARAAAQERGLDGKCHHVVRSTSSRSCSSRRAATCAKRSSGMDRPRRRRRQDRQQGTIAEMVALRAEQARLLGFPDFAHYRLDDAMAKTPAAVRDLLQTVWPRARERALADRDAMQALVQAEGGNFALAPWDWRYYVEKLRKLRCDFDEAEIKPYLRLENMIEAAFYTAQRLFGLTFAPREDVPAWHEDVRVWEVSAADGRHLGLFFGDYFARASKHSGAWMTTLRDQEQACRRYPPACDQRDEFLQGGRRRAGAAELRRRPHAVPRIRPCPA